MNNEIDVEKIRAALKEAIKGTEHLLKHYPNGFISSDIECVGSSIHQVLSLLPKSCETCGGSGISKKCPQCGENLIKVLMNTNCPLNEEQFDSVRAGDYYCPKCPDNNRGRGKMCYWWKSELSCPDCQASKLVCYGCCHADALKEYPGQPSGERPCHFCIRNPKADCHIKEWYNGSKPVKVPMDCYHSLDMLNQIEMWQKAPKVPAGKVEEFVFMAKGIDAVLADEKLWSDGKEILKKVKAFLETQAKQIEQLEEALKLAYEAMNYLGDILNKHDMVQPEDEAITKEAFEVVSKIVGKTKPSKGKNERN